MENIISTIDYKNHFWNALRGKAHSEAVFDAGRERQTGSYILPAASEDGCDRAIRKEGLFRNIATVVKAVSSPRTVMTLPHGYRRSEKSLWLTAGRTSPDTPWTATSWQRL